MSDFLSEYYLFLKTMHIISIICWMAGLFYIPRLFSYHAKVDPFSEMASTFCVMEARLTRIIMNPSMIASFIFGFLLICVPGMLEPPAGWLHLKLGMVMLMAGYHGFMMRCKRQFAHGYYPLSSKAFRLINEIPPLLMMVIIFLVVFKPF